MISKRPIQRVLEAIGLLFFFAAPLFASDASNLKVLQGFEQLRQGNDEEALRLFHSAIHYDEHDAQAWLYAGVAANQLGRPMEALQSLNRAAEAGCHDPEMLFQTGRAQLLVGRYPEATQSLQQFETGKPGRGQTSEFLGRAFAAIGDYKNATEAFRLAIQRDPALRSTVLPYQANLAQLQNDQENEKQRIRDLFWYAPDSATAQVLRSEFGLSIESFDESSDHSPLKLSVAISGGYNTDVQGIEVISVLGNTFGRSSAFDETSLDGSYTWTGLFTKGAGHPADEFVLSAGALLDDYPAAEEGDIFSSTLSGEYRRPLFGSLSGSLKLAGDYDALNWHGFRDGITGRAALQAQVNSHLSVEASYTGAANGYLYDPAPVQNPDAISSTYSLDAYLDLSSREVPMDRAIALHVGGFFMTNRSKGADFDYNGGGVVAGVDFPLIQHINGELLYTWSDDRYLNLNSLTIDPGDPLLQPTGRRNDVCNTFGLRLSRQMREWNRHLTIFTGFEFSQNSSTISAYRFSQQIVRLGISWGI